MNVILTDSSLRDGNHQVQHTISLESIERYCSFAETANIPIIEVGHGNGLAASSLLIGKSPNTDIEMLSVAKKNLKKTKLGVHVIPGIATKKNLNEALDCGVEIFRIATHCTEATLAKSHIEFIANKNKTVFGVLMMSALISVEELIKQAKILEDYGAHAVIIMDSTGSYLPVDVEERISSLKKNLKIDVGFHAHNNLGCAIFNSVTAVQNGAIYVDVCIRGFGAGAGNAAIEILIPVLERMGYKLNVNFEKIIKEADNVMDYLIPSAPSVTPINVLTGLKKLFSGFEKPIIKASKLHGLEYSSLIFELGDRKLVAGQEDIIHEIALKLKNETLHHK
jgi:4-hydroxy 2-oxovalerate aldolase